MESCQVKTVFFFCLLMSLLFVVGCSSNGVEASSTQPAVSATLVVPKGTQSPQCLVFVRVPHYRVQTGYASVFGRRYYGGTVLKSEAPTQQKALKDQPLEGLIGDDISLCDIYFVVDRVEPVMSASIYLRTEVSCRVTLSGFTGQLLDQGTGEKHDAPFVFGPGTYQLQTVQER